MNKKLLYFAHEELNYLENNLVLQAFCKLQESNESEAKSIEFNNFETKNKRFNAT